MDEKYEIIGEIANILAKHNKKLYANKLASWLNDLGIKNSSGNKYIEKGRGIYKTIKCAYDEHKKCNTTADNVADQFIDKSGKPAWKE